MALSSNPDCHSKADPPTHRQNCSLQRQFPCERMSKPSGVFVTVCLKVRWVFSYKVLVILLFSPSLCTPPMPPVTNTGIPALCAAIIVADTVVPPESPWENNMHIQDSIHVIKVGETVPPAEPSCMLDRYWFEVHIWHEWIAVSLCWWRRADHDGTPSGSSCSGQGGQAPLTTNRRGLYPQSLQPWRE